MGKLTGSLQFTGKFKDAVGYKSAAAKKSSTNFVRGYAASVSNPKSYAQALQRAKTVPAAIFYSAFESVLNHAFLPSGNKSRNQARFRSLAMRLDSIPDVRKGEQIIPCIDYQISEGSLGLSSKTFGQSYLQEAILFPQMAYNGEISLTDLTIGEFSANIEQANIGLVDGMELTFLGVLLNKEAYDLTGSSADRLAAHFSIVLNAADTVTKLSDVISPMLMINVSQEGKLLLSHRDETAFYLLSGGLIISEKTASSWRYTNSRMTIVDPDFVDTDGVVESYMDESNSRTSEKILQQADNSSSSLVRPVSGTTVEFALSPSIDGATLSATSAAVAVMSTGDRRVIVRAGALLTVNDDLQLVPVTKTVGGVTSTVLLSETNLAGNRTITEQEAAGIPFSSVSIENLYFREGSFDGDLVCLVVNQSGQILTDGNNVIFKNITESSEAFGQTYITGSGGPIGAAVSAWGSVAAEITILDSQTGSGSFVYLGSTYAVAPNGITPAIENYPE